MYSLKIQNIYWNKFKPILVPITMLILVATILYSLGYSGIKTIYEAIMPPINEHISFIYRKKDSDHVAIEMPSFSRDQINVELGEKALVITADNKDEANFMKFTYILPLKKDMNIDKIESSFKNGILTIYIPRAERKTRKININ